MIFMKRIRIRDFELGLHFRNGKFLGLLEPGRHTVFDPTGDVRVDVVDVRTVRLVHEEIEQIARSDAVRDRAVVVDLKDHDRGLVWVDGRFSEILPKGVNVLWRVRHDVRVEIVDAREVRFRHDELSAVINVPESRSRLEVCYVYRHHVGVLFVDGQFVELLPAGRYAFWRGGPTARIACVDMRQSSIDINGQEIMTSDKVTLRLNALVTYKVANALRSVEVSADPEQELYRAAQLALREAVGRQTLDAFLTAKEAVSKQVVDVVRPRAEELGLAIVAAGIRDVILPGEMKELMNRVTEAKKAAEANLIARREETAAMRSQANTARLLADNPTLMRLKELEVLESISAAGGLKVMLGEKGLTERVINLL